MNNFSKNLTELMSGENISQPQLAKVLNVKQQTISRYMNGEREPDINTLIAIAKFFNVSLDDLLL